jgi:hypothetical protein
MDRRVANSILTVADENLDRVGKSRAPTTQEGQRGSGVVLGTLIGLGDSTRPLVDFPGNPSRKCLEARSIAVLEKEDIGREVLLQFEEGDHKRPVVLGLLQSPKDRPGTARDDRIVDLQIDRERLVVTADKELVLRCGEASITLTSAGKVLIRGTYVLTRSSGLNRIKGGVVHIN